MVEKKKVMIPKENIVSKTCDICGKVSKNPSVLKGKDYLNSEFDEYVSFSVNAGYNAKFLKDGMSLSFDTCEECFCKKILPIFKNVTFHPTFNYSEEEIKNMTIDDI